MSNKREYFRVRRGKHGTVFVDEDGNVLSLDEMRVIAQEITDTIEQPEWVYVGIRESDNALKVGITRDLERRQSELGITLVATKECERFGEHSASKVESELLQFLQDYAENIEGEFFAVTDAEVYALKNLMDHPVERIVRWNEAVGIMDEIVHDQSPDISFPGLLVSIFYFSRDPIKTLAAAWSISNYKLTSESELEKAFWHGISVACSGRNLYHSWVKTESNPPPPPPPDTL
jgi:hypothetical protein